MSTYKISSHNFDLLRHFRFGDLCITSTRRFDITNDIVVITGVPRLSDTFVRCWSPGYYAVTRDVDVWRAAHELVLVGR